MTGARLISVAGLRAYLGVSGAELARMRKAVPLPAPVPGTRKYDIEAVKRALDALGERSLATVAADG
jgi:hypothetical protein